MSESVKPDASLIVLFTGVRFKTTPFLWTVGLSTACSREYAPPRLPSPSPAVQALVERLLAPRQVLKSGSCPDLESEMPAFFGDNPVVPVKVSTNLFEVFANPRRFEGRREAEWRGIKEALLSILNPQRVFKVVSETHVLVLPPGSKGLTRPKPDVLVGFHYRPALRRRFLYTLIASNDLPLRARCGDVEGPLFPFFVQERRADRGSELECLHELLGGLRTAMHAWELVLERQNIAIVGMTLVGLHLGLYVMECVEYEGDSLYIAYHVQEFSIFNDRDLPRLMSLMDDIREEGSRLFDLLAHIRWQDLQDPECDEEGSEDEESDDDRGSSKPRHKKRRLLPAGAKDLDPVVDSTASTAKVQGWVAQSHLEGPGVAPGVEDPHHPTFRPPVCLLSEDVVETPQRGGLAAGRICGATLRDRHAFARYGSKFTAQWPSGWANLWRRIPGVIPKDVVETTQRGGLAAGRICGATLRDRHAFARYGSKFTAQWPSGWANLWGHAEELLAISF
ncbi:hypothetical protein SpCBS45565_g05369 [Spizellomyces sp. 'palustris']|nr:hypothetical protein SpCBS45565_g05369 [Spizellomyces sp. 'palustris']